MVAYVLCIMPNNLYEHPPFNNVRNVCYSSDSIIGVQLCVCEQYHIART